MESHHTEQRRGDEAGGKEGMRRWRLSEVFAMEGVLAAFFCAVALGATEGEKWAYFELLLEINGLEGRVLTGGVKKVLGRHGMQTYGAKNEG